MNIRHALINSDWIGAYASIQDSLIAVMRQLGPFHALQIDERDLEQFVDLTGLEERLCDEFPDYRIGAEIWCSDG